MLKKSFLANTLLGSLISITASIIGSDAAISSNVVLIAPTPNPIQEYPELARYSTNQGFYNYGICLLQRTHGYIVVSETSNSNLRRYYRIDNSCSTLQVGQVPIPKPNLETQTFTPDSPSIPIIPRNLSGTGICNYPDDLDSRGRRCGGRAKYK